MYFNDIHILIYLVIGFIGCIVGQCVEIVNKRLIEHKKVFSLELWRDIKNKKYSMNYILMVIMFIIYIAILYVCGIHDVFYANLDLISYFVLAPMMVSVFIIDYKEEIIPNRLVLTLFEVRIVFCIFNWYFKS